MRCTWQLGIYNWFIFFQAPERKKWARATQDAEAGEYACNNFFIDEVHLLSEQLSEITSKVHPFSISTSLLEAERFTQNLKDHELKKWKEGLQTSVFEGNWGETRCASYVDHCGLGSIIEPSHIRIVRRDHDTKYNYRLISTLLCIYRYPAPGPFKCTIKPQTPAVGALIRDSFLFVKRIAPRLELNDGLSV